MPVYRSSDATDLLRLLAVCILHPIVHETTMSIQRTSNERSYVLKVTSNDPQRMHFALASLGGGKLMAIGAESEAGRVLPRPSPHAPRNTPRLKPSQSSHSAAHLLEAVFIMYRRLMLGIIREPLMVMLAVVVTAFEEVAVRATMVYRDNFFRWLQGLPEPTAEEKELQLRLWATSTATAM